MWEAAAAAANSCARERWRENNVQQHRKAKKSVTLTTRRVK